MFSRVSRVISQAVLNSRSFSSKSEQAKILHCRLPSNLSEAFYGEMSDYYSKIISQHSATLKPVNEFEIEAWTKKFMEISQNISPDFLSQIREIQAKKPIVSIFDGISVPQIPADILPRTMQDLSNPKFINLARTAEISIAVISRVMGVNLGYDAHDRLVGFIFATDSDSQSAGSFKSSHRDLKWHNDGWSTGNPYEAIVLCGVVGHQMAQTEIIIYSDIEKYFKENNREDLLKELNREFWVDGLPPEESTKLRIMDSKKGEIIYADYADFMPNISNGSFKASVEALETLKQALEEISPIAVNLSEGTLVGIRNKQSVHQRTKKIDNQTPEIEKNFLVGKRLLTRVLGEQIITPSEAITAYASAKIDNKSKSQDSNSNQI